MDTLIHNAKRFKALGYPIRLCLLSLIASSGGGRNVSDLQKDLAGYGYVKEQPTISVHLRILSEAGFIEAEYAGLEHYYHLCDEAFAASQDALADLVRLGEIEVAS